MGASAAAPPTSGPTQYVDLAVTSQLLDTLATAVVDNVTLNNSVSTLGGAKVLAKPTVNVPQRQSNFCTGRGYKTGCTITSYYTFDGQRVAMSRDPRSVNRNGERYQGRKAGVVTWLHADMLGSASMTTDANGNKTSELRYKPFGEVRNVWGAMPTDRQFTGQLSVGLGAIDFGGGTRLYSPLFGRFLSADAIVPNPSDPQSLNRYS